MKALIQKLRSNQLLQDFVSLFKSAEMDLSSIAVAYYLMLTIFPFMVLIANIFPYLAIDTQELLIFLKGVLPEQLYVPIANIVRTIFSQPSSSLLWLSILSGLWTISKGVTYLQKALNKAYGQQEHRDFLLGRLLGMLIALLTVLFLALGIVLSTFGKAVLDFLSQYLGLDTWLHDLLLGLLQPATFGIFVLALGILYYLLPSVKIDKIRYVMPGTILTSVTFLLVTSVFSNLVSQVINRMDNLRSAGSIAMFVVMFWFIFFAKVLIIGGICNATYQKTKVQTFTPRQTDVWQLLKSWFTHSR